MTYRERLNKVRTKTDAAWLSRTIGYPIGWRLVALIGDIPWITPNLLTIIGLISVIAAAILFCFQDITLNIIATVLLFLHLIMDCADGTLARYRHSSSNLGAFLDKVGDAIGFSALATAAGIRAYFEAGPFHNSPWIVAVGALGGTFFVIVCYMYWVVAYAELKNNIKNNTVKPEGLEHPPKAMSLKDELIFILKAQPLIISFNEGDFTLWMPLLVFLGRSDILAWLFFVTQGATVLKMLYVRGRAMVALDHQGNKA